MTREERTYFHNDLVSIFNAWVASLSPSQQQIATLQLQQFEAEYMCKITDNTPLPQDVFRVFLRTLNIDALLQQISEKWSDIFQPISNSTIDALFE